MVSNHDGHETIVSQRLVSFPSLIAISNHSKRYTYNYAEGVSTQQNSYSISQIRDTVPTRWLDSDSIVTVDNCRQHSDNTVD